jgi:dTDP-4-dehydrorhamnose reductase
MKRLLITGANGQLGNEFRQIARWNNDYMFFFTDVTEQKNCHTDYLDITDKDAVYNYVKSNAIDVIVNCAAYTNVEAAEDNFDLAKKLNTDAPDILAKVMKSVDGLLIHISTDYVFGKEPYNKPCKENQEGTPTGVYGFTKLNGETNIINSGCKYVIVRTSWLYSEFGKNFFKTMVDLIGSKDELKVVLDQVGTPTYAYDLASVIMIIIKNPVYGIYNYSNEGVCSWYDFTCAIRDVMMKYRDYGKIANIIPCHSDEFPSKVTRPSYSVLDKTKIKETYDLRIPHWYDSLENCAHYYFED